MRPYSFATTVMLINGVEITGWADGDDVIKISRRVDSASDKVGAGGDMMVSLSSNKSGTFEFTLQQTSSSNKFLNSLMDRQEAGALTFVPISAMFQDIYRNDLASGSAGYLVKPADMNRGENGNNVTWQVVVERLDMLLGDPGMVLGGLLS